MRWVCTPRPSHRQAHGLAGLQEDRVRLHAEPDAGRRAGGDDVARMQRHEVADVADELAPRRRSSSCVVPSCMRLPSTSSHSGRFCGSGISSLVTSHGPIGPNVSQPLPLSQCRRARSGTRARTRRCRRNSRRRSRAPRSPGRSARVRADDDAELDFPVGLLRAARQLRRRRSGRDSAPSDFRKMIGSFGIGMPVSAAWSA